MSIYILISYKQQTCKSEYILYNTFCTVYVLKQKTKYLQSYAFHYNVVIKHLVQTITMFSHIEQLVFSKFLHNRK